jgi:hypothetical protein
MKFSERETFYWVDSAQLLDMTREVMDDIWTHKFNQLKKLWPELSPKLLRKMRKQVDAAHLKWLESRPKNDLEIIQNPVALVNKVIQLKKLPIEEMNDVAEPLKKSEEMQRAAISCALNLANTQQVLEYCQIQESQRVANWILINLHLRHTSIDQLAKQREHSQILFGLALTDSKLHTLNLIKMGLACEGMVKQAESDAWKKKDLNYLNKLEKARVSKAKRLKSLDHISDIPIFLCAYWCGFDGLQIADCIQPPPLCFFSWGAIASYLDIILKLKNDKRTNVANVRQWGSRLGLQPVREKIVNEFRVNNGIYFLP